MANTIPHLGHLPIRIWVGVCLAWSLTASFVDLSMAVLYGPPDLATVYDLAFALAIDVVAFAVLFGITAYPIAAVLSRLPAAVALATSFAAAFFVSGVLVLGSPLSRVFSYECQPDSLLCPPQVGRVIVPLMCAALVILILGRIAVSSILTDTSNRAIARFALVAAPLLFGISMATVWLVTYEYPPHGAAHDAVIAICGAALAAFAVYLAHAIARSGRAPTFLAVFSLVIISPVARWVTNRPIPDVARLQRPLPPAGPHPKTVLFITVDALRADALSCYGNATRTTAIDALASDGLLFENAISPAPWTVPAVTSLMTGLDPLTLQVGSWMMLSPNVPTLAEQMSDAGYYTAAIITNEHLAADSGLARGFHEYRSVGLPFELPPSGAFAKHLLVRLSMPPVQQAIAPTVTDAAIRLLEQHRDEHIFLWLHYLDPHAPYAPPSSLLPVKTAVTPTADSFNGNPETPVQTPEALDRIRALYQGEVRYVDDNIGSLVSALRRLGRYESAVIVFTADHGEAFWEHGHGGHGVDLYREVLHVPLIIKTEPPLKKRRISPFVSTQSVMATLLDMARLPYHSPFAPEPSLTSLFDDAGGIPSRPILSANVASYVEKVAVFFSNMEYIWSAGTNREELYDLVRDPGEQMSIALITPDTVTAAQEVAAERTAAAQRLRNRYHINSTTRAVDIDQLRRLRALGYLR